MRLNRTLETTVAKAALLLSMTPFAGIAMAQRGGSIARAPSISFRSAPTISSPARSTVTSSSPSRATVTNTGRYTHFDNESSSGSHGFSEEEIPSSSGKGSSSSRGNIFHEEEDYERPIPQGARQPLTMSYWQLMWLQQNQAHLNDYQRDAYKAEKKAEVDETKRIAEREKEDKEFKRQGTLWGLVMDAQGQGARAVVLNEIKKGTTPRLDPKTIYDPDADTGKLPGDIKDVVADARKLVGSIHKADGPQYLSEMSTIVHLTKQAATNAAQKAALAAAEALVNGKIREEALNARDVAGYKDIETGDFTQFTSELRTAVVQDSKIYPAEAACEKQPNHVFDRYDFVAGLPNFCRIPVQTPTAASRPALTFIDKMLGLVGIHPAEEVQATKTKNYVESINGVPVDSSYYETMSGHAEQKSPPLGEGLAAAAVLALAAGGMYKLRKSGETNARHPG